MSPFYVDFQEQLSNLFDAVTVTITEETRYS